MSSLCPYPDPKSGQMLKRYSALYYWLRISRSSINSEALQADLEEKGSRIPKGLQLINGQSIYVPSLEGNSFKAPVPGIPKEQSARFPFVNCI